MSRTLSQIYSEALLVRNDYLQITELNSGLTKGKLSIMNLLTYVMACLIYTYETILDVFEYNIAQLILERVNGTGIWYEMLAKKFQYDTANDCADTLVLNEETLTLEYENVDESHRIIANASIAEREYSGMANIIVNKLNNDEESANNGNVFIPLTSNELKAFKEYMFENKFIGLQLFSRSIYGDLVTIKSTEEAPIFYDSTKMSEEKAMANIKEVLLGYCRNFKFNGYISYQEIIDTILSAEGIVDVDSNVTINITKASWYNSETYDTYTLTNRKKAESGYVRIADNENVCTVNSQNIYLKPETA